MSFFGNHVNLTPASQSDWNKNNSKDAAHIKNRPFFIDDNGEIHKLNKDFLPDEVALKEDIRVTSVNGMTGDVVIEAGGGDSVIISDGIYVQENEPVGAEDGALWVDLDEEVEVKQPGVGQFGLGKNAEVFNGIDPANASGDYSHAEGRDTIAAGVNSHVQGAYNLKDNGNRYAHIVGNGNHGNRSNAHTLDWNGNAWFQGEVYVGGSSQDDADRLVKFSELGENFNSQPDWNQNDENASDYIKNRTHYEEDPVVFSIAPTSMGVYHQVEFNNNFDITENEYVIVVNGDTYRLTGQYDSLHDIIFLGNPYYVNGIDADSDIPFAIVDNTFISDVYGKYQIKITLTENGNDIEVTEEELLLFSSKWFDNTILEMGHNYRVTFDGSTYSFTPVQVDATMIRLGDISRYDFCLQFYPETSETLVCWYKPGVHTISLTDQTADAQIVITQTRIVDCVSSEFYTKPDWMEDKVCAISWDGEIYQCIVKKHKDIYYLGNPIYDWNLYGSEESYFSGTEISFEPFCIIWDGEYSEILYDYGIKHVISLECVKKDVHALPSKYLPSSVPHAAAEWPIYEGKVNIEAGSGGNYLDFSTPLVPGQLYEIQMNDKIYYSKCQQSTETGYILGSYLAVLMAALVGQGIPEGYYEIYYELIKILLPIIQPEFANLEPYEDIPFGIIQYNGNRYAMVTVLSGEYQIKISPVTKLFNLNPVLLPEIELPKRQVYAEFPFKDMQFIEGTSSMRFAQLSQTNAESMSVDISLYKDIYLSLVLGYDIKFFGAPINELILDNTDPDVLVINTGFTISVDDESDIVSLLLVVSREGYSFPGQEDIILSPGLWYVDNSDSGLNQLLNGMKIVFASSNKQLTSGVLPSIMAKKSDISLYYDKQNFYHTEQVYAEWDKDVSYPESTNGELVVLSYEKLPIKQLYGKHYLTIRKAENGNIITDIVLDKENLLQDGPLYALDEIKCIDWEELENYGLLALELLGQPDGTIFFPKEPEDDSLIYFKIYEPMKQLDDSLLSNNIARKEDLPCHDETVYYEWDEDTEYETSVGLPANDTISKYVKISNDAPDSNFFLGKQYSARGFFSDNEVDFDATISEQHLTPISDGAYAVVETTLVVTTDSVVFNGVTLTKGIWSASEYLDASFKYYWWKIYDPAKTIEEKYLPDTVVKSSDLQGKILINPEIASVGQLMMVEEVDESGAPIKWRAVDANSLLNAILPPISEEDNGKTLTVVDGTWQLI